MSSVRRLTAILAADVAGYSRLMGADEEGTLERLKAWRLAHRAVLLGIGNGRGYGYRHGLGDLVLEREDIGQIAVVALGPDVLPGLGLHQLSGDPDAITGFAQAALEYVPHTQLAPDLLKRRRRGPCR
jgi:hypothetical protein